LDDMAKNRARQPTPIREKIIIRTSSKVTKTNVQRHAGGSFIVTRKIDTNPSDIARERRVDA
jgi:deferrochelatase/peroxidase EfeB